MKTLFFACSLLILCVVGASGQMQDTVPIALRQWEITRGKIVYKVQVQEVRGTRVMIFDDWGARQKMYEEVSMDTAAMEALARGTGAADGGKALLDMLKAKSDAKVVHIDIPGYSYVLDLIAKKGTKRTKQAPEFYLSLRDIYSDASITNEEYMRKPCICINDSATETKMWVWKNIVLKSEEMRDGVVVSSVEAVSIDENPVIAPDEFDVPKDIHITEISRTR